MRKGPSTTPPEKQTSSAGQGKMDGQTAYFFTKTIRSNSILWGYGTVMGILEVHESNKWWYMKGIWWWYILIRGIWWWIAMDFRSKRFAFTSHRLWTYPKNVLGSLLLHSCTWIYRKILGLIHQGSQKSPKKKPRKMLETKTSWVIMDSFGPGQISIAYVILIDIHWYTSVLARE